MEPFFSPDQHERISTTAQKYWWEQGEYVLRLNYRQIGTFGCDFYIIYDTSKFKDVSLLVCKIP